MYFRYVDENGNNYNVTMNIEGPYGPVSIFTGPKVRVDLYRMISVHSLYFGHACICTK